MSLKKNISIKLLLPTIAVIFTAAAFLGWKISNYVEDNIRKEAEIGVNTALERISETLGATNEVLTNQVSAALKILKEKGLRSGVPELGKPVELKTGTVPDLLLGGQSQYNNFKLVDEMKSLMGASATLFVKNGDDFVRLSTNIIKSDGSRVIGTKLDPSGKAIAKVKQGESFIGAVDILGFPYLTGYEPMYNSSHQTIGVWFVGYPASTLNMIGKTIGRIRIAQNGFTVLLDNKGKLLFRSDNVSEKLAENILNETEKNKDTDKSKGWIIKKTKFEAWGYTIAAAYPESDIQSEVNQARVHVLLLSILAALILTGVIYGLVRALIIKPVKLLSDASARVASGDFNVSVALKVQDELGILASSFNKMVLSIKNSITEIHQKKEEAEKAVKEANRVKEEIHLHREYLQDSTARILSEMEKFSAGDLTAHLKAEKDDDIGKLISGFNTAVARMRKMVGEVQSAILTAANAGNEISSSTRQMAAGAADQAGKIAGIAAAAEQITGKIAESTKNAETSSAKAKTAGIKAHEGGKVVRETIEGMNKIAGVVLSSASTIGELGQSSSRIGEIIEVINDIADQTNLLALNAAIEAARAGEQGMGFAVVADEVRKLAERTTRATKQISIMIDDIRKNTSGAVDAIQKGKEEVDKGKFLADRAGCVLEEIIEQTDELSSIIEQVAHANEEQSEASREISRNIEAISAATQQSAAGVRQVARSTEDLNSLTETLQELVSVFKLKD